MKKILLFLSMMLMVLLTYAQSCPDSNHPHAIDLGLPSGTKWACCNVGATTPEGYGGYYAWGEKKMKSVFNEVTYKYCSGTDTNGDGWLDEIVNYKELGSISGTKYDVAHRKWGGKWQMPSPEQIVELLNNCTSRWITMKGVSGRIFTSSNDNSIFLPAAGYHNGSSLTGAGNNGGYWSGQDLEDSALDLDFDLDGAHCYSMSRCCGYSVRPISR